MSDLRTTLKAPTAELLDRAAECANRYRRGAFGEQARLNHYNAVFLTALESPPRYEVHVWGDPAGHVRAFAYSRGGGA